MELEQKSKRRAAHDSSALNVQTPERDTAEVAKEEHPFDLGWKERTFVLGTLCLLLIALFLVVHRYRPSQAVELLGIVPAAFVAIGKFLPLLSVTGGSSLGPYELGAVIWALDSITVIVFVYSFEAFYRVGPLRRVLDKIHVNMQLVLQAYPRIEKASVVGVVLFVLFPLSGTGALAGAIIGIILGINRFVLMAAVSLGGCVGGFLMAFMAANFSEFLLGFKAVQKNPTYKYLILAGVALVVVAALYGLNRAFKRALHNAKVEQERKAAI